MDIIAENDGKPFRSIARLGDGSTVILPGPRQGLSLGETPVQRAMRFYTAAEEIEEIDDMDDSPGRIRSEKQPEATYAAIQRMLSEIETAALSRTDLGALRRRIAWLCHPDRVTDSFAARSDMMAQANAKIDAVIARKPNV